MGNQDGSDVLTTRYLELVNALGRSLGFRSGWKGAVADFLGPSAPQLSRYLNRKRQVSADIASRGALNAGLTFEVLQSSEEIPELLLDEAIRRFRETVDVDEDPDLDPAKRHPVQARDLAPWRELDRVLDRLDEEQLEGRPALLMDDLRRAMARIDTFKITTTAAAARDLLEVADRRDEVRDVPRSLAASLVAAWRPVVRAMLDRASAHVASESDSDS